MTSEKPCPYPDCQDSWGHPRPHLIEATAIEKHLAAERRATVERIRAAARDQTIRTGPDDDGGYLPTYRLRAILDAEAER